jgi:hypothetical protein
MAKGKKRIYALRVGMVLEKKFKGHPYKLSVAKSGDTLEFRLGNKVFFSLTAAAKHVSGGKNEINGPRFWGLPTK